MKMVVVEPHADDAFLSLGGLIEKWRKEGRDVTILTVYSGDAGRRADAQAYAKAVGAEWMGVGATGTHNARENGPGRIDPIGQDVLDLITGQNTRVILPLCIGDHPEHHAVKTVIGAFIAHEFLLYYVDQPYASKLKNQDQLHALVRDKTVYAIYRPGARKYRHVPLFKHQAKFFHFNPASDLEMKGFELVVY